MYQEKDFAIEKAAELASKASAGNFRVNIYVDSQAAIKVIVSFRISGRSVLESRATLESVARYKRLYIYWVPGHKGVGGNEIVDVISKTFTRKRDRNW